MPLELRLCPLWATTVQDGPEGVHDSSPGVCAAHGRFLGSCCCCWPSVLPGSKAGGGGLRQLFQGNHDKIPSVIEHHACQRPQPTQELSGSTGTPWGDPEPESKWKLLGENCSPHTRLFYTISSLPTLPGIPSSWQYQRQKRPWVLCTFAFF